MSSIILEAIAASMLELEREVPTPTGQLGYGRDLSCVFDLTEDLAEVDPLSPVGIGQSLLRRLITTRGTLLDDPDYGLDVRSFCNRGVPESELVALAGQIKLEATKDDRIADVAVSITLPTPNAYSIAITITPEDATRAPFPLVFAVENGQLTVEALG